MLTKEDYTARILSWEKLISRNMRIHELDVATLCWCRPVVFQQLREGWRHTDIATVTAWQHCKHQWCVQSQTPARQLINKHSTPSAQSAEKHYLGCSRIYAAFRHYAEQIVCSVHVICHSDSFQLRTQVQHNERKLYGYTDSCSRYQSNVHGRLRSPSSSSSSSSLPFNSCRSTGRRRYSATPHDLVILMPCSPLCSSSVSCFPAPSQLSSSMCSLVFLCLDNLEGSISELFSLYCCQLSSLCAQSRSTSYE